MAKILEEFIVLKVSKIARDGDDQSLHVMSAEVVSTLTEAAEQILATVGVSGCVVEVETATQ